jgi:hypothetical protein
MKRIITFWGLITALLLSVTESSAQIRFGVKGGVNLANVAISDASSYSIESRVGFFAGPTALIAIPVKGFELDASLLFDQRGVETETPDLSGGRTFWTTTTQHQITIPVNVRYNLTSGEGTRLFIFAGPQLGINIGKRENETDYGTFVFNKSSFSINTGIGLLFSQHFQVSASYNVVCGKNAEIWINRQWGIGQQVNKSRFNAWQFSVGYYF